MKEEFPPFRTFNHLTNIRVILLIGIIGFATYFNSLFNPFIIDDIAQIVENPYIVNPYIANQHNISVFFNSSIGVPLQPEKSFQRFYFKPLLYTTYFLLHAFFKLTPFFFHLLQLTLHIFNTVLVFFIFEKFIKHRLISLFMSLIFLVHPLNSEAVIYIANLQDILFMSFGLIALNKLIKLGESTKITIKKLLFLPVTILLALLSKESAMLFVFLLFFYSYIFDRKNIKYVSVAVTGSGLFYGYLRSRAASHILWYILPSLIQRSPLLVRIQSIPKIILYYISKFFVPVNFAVLQDWVVKNINFSNFVLPLIIELTIIACIVLLGVHVFKRFAGFSRTYLFFVFWLVLGMSLHIQVFPLDQTVADRWFYFPMVGLLGIVGVLLNVVSVGISKLRNNNKLLPLLGYGAIFIILSLSTLTVIRNSQWKSSTRLFTHDVAFAEDSSKLNNMLGGDYLQSGDLGKAKYHFEKSLILDPDFGNSINSMGLIYELERDIINAKSFYAKNIALNDGLPKNLSYQGLSRIALLYERNPKLSREISEAALQKYPLDPLLLEILANAQYFEGEKDKSLETAQKLFEYQPTQANYYLVQEIVNNTLILPEL